MAKKKITLEEKLEEAIIKDSPHKVPDNWAWTTIKSICGINMGQSPKSENVNDIGEGYPLIGGPSDMGELYPFKKRYATNVNKKSSNGTIIMSIRATLGKINISDGEYCLGRGVAEIIPKGFIREYLQYYINYITKDLYKAAKGTTFLQISKPDLESIEVPLPPLKEQQRIVDKIESLFEKLDKAKELLEEARSDFEKRKQSIIENSLMGKYLSEVKLAKVELGDILSLKNGMSKRNGKEGKETKVLRLADVSSDAIYSENARSMLLTEKEITNYKIENGDLVLIRVNGTKKNVGKAIEYIGQDICAYCDHLIRIDCSQINRSYIKYLINSDNVRRQIDEMIVSSAGQNTISQSSLNKIKTMWVEDNKVQEEIVEVINTLINKEKSIEELTALEEQIELIKKSILAKAFRGQLGTNCEEDESALELLKEILSKE